MANSKSVWDTLSAVDVSGHTEKKGKFTYLSWTWAWGLVKGLYPAATFEKKTFRDNQNNILPFMRDHKRYTYVACSVTIEGIVQEEIYPVTDNRNEPVLDANSYQVNTALQRCLVKCLAYHGLGTQVYAGEVLPVFAEDNRTLDVKAATKLSDTICKDFHKSTTVDDLKSKWEAYSSKIAKLDNNHQKLVQTCYKTALSTLRQDKPKSA